jgi:hypothetical protein
VGEQGKSMIAGVAARLNRPRPARTLRSSLGDLKARARKLFYETVLGRSGLQAMELGTFRLTSGQVSYRMYDRYSLERLFLSAGFSDVSLKSAETSGYPSWGRVNLDLSPDGTAARPHALIMEGVRG